MSMLMLALMHTGMHVYVREKRRREQRGELGNVVAVWDMVVSLWGVGDAKP